MKTLIASTIIGFVLITSCANAQDSIQFSSPVISIGLVTTNLDQSLAFYKDVIGMIEVRQFDASAEFATKIGLTNNMPASVHVLKLEDSKAATEWKVMSFGKPATHPQQNYVHDDTGMQYLTIMVNSLTSLMERFKKHNIKLLGSTPHQVGENRFIVTVQDPDGNFVELIGSM